MTPKKVYLAIPTYKRQLDAGFVIPLLMLTKKGHRIQLGNIDTSACALRFNQMLIQAVDGHRNGDCDFFVLWHSDVAPEAWWLDKMLEIQEQTGAEILSAIIPIKDNRGLTSTAFDEEAGDVPKEWSPRRLTMAEVMQKPETFTADNLLLNTGLFMLDLSSPWLDLEKIRFHIDDEIRRLNGQLMAVFKPEDWNFSRDARALGCTKQYATRAIKLAHYGECAFPNTEAWGTLQTDTRKVILADISEAMNEASKIQGWMSPAELEYLATKAKGEKTVLEIGSWKGRSTKAMAMTNTKRVIACDHWRGSSNGDATGVEAGAQGSDAIYQQFVENVAKPHPHVQIVRGESALLQDELPKTRIIGEPVDFCFIDGDHAYPYVSCDIRTCKELVAPGGTISGHDLNEPGVEQAVKELLPGYKVVQGTSIWEWTAPNALTGSSFRLLEPCTETGTSLESSDGATMR